MKTVIKIEWSLSMREADKLQKDLEAANMEALAANIAKRLKSELKRGTLKVEAVKVDTGSYQLDMFGNEIPLSRLPKRGGIFKTMQQIYGYTCGKRCKECKHLTYHKGARKIYYKCDLWFMSHLAATDIRLKNPACGEFEEAEK